MDSRSFQDHFFKKAKISGYRSRSAFKLIELDKKFKFLKNGIKLLDVGSFPGGWSQIASKKIKKGKILSIDKKRIQELEGVKFILGDFLEYRRLKLDTCLFHYLFLGHGINWQYVAISNVLNQ